jgi:hypothetical protein
MKFIGALFILLVVAAFLSVPFWVFSYNTGSGEHTGIVTSVEKNGIFFKTDTAYVKTNTTSSQEDAYCVIDPAVYAELQQDAIYQSPVNVYYVSWLKAGIQNCDGEGAIITQVTPQE